MAVTLINSPADRLCDIDFSSSAPVLAHGDSWFAFGSFPPWTTGNLLQQVQFQQDVTIVNFGHQGEELQNLFDEDQYPYFVEALTLRGMPAWKAILVSGGGNDLIDWLQRSPNNVKPSQRLLLAPSERAQSGSVDRYLSVPGWFMICQQILTAYQTLSELRSRSTDSSSPIIAHVYDYFTPRDSGPTGTTHSAWIAPYLRQIFQIPDLDWIPLAHLLIDKFHDFLSTVVCQHIKNMHVIDTRGCLAPATLGSIGPSGGWENEIHPTPSGYQKLATERFIPGITAITGLK